MSLRSSSAAPNKTKQTIKPIDPSDFNPGMVSYSTVNIHPTYGNKTVYTKISNNNSENGDRFLVVARGCKIITGVSETVPYGSRDGNVPAKADGKKPTLQVYFSITDKKFQTMFELYESSLISKGVELSNEWFNTEMNDEDCSNMLKKSLVYNKFGVSFGGKLSPDFKCKSKIEQVSDVSDLKAVLCKNTIVDVSFSFDSISLGATEYKINCKINQINIVGIADSTSFQSNAIKPENYISDKITLTDKETHIKGGKFCKFLYDGSPFRVRLEDISAKIWKNIDKDNKVSFSLCVEMTNNTNKNMFNNVYDNIIKILEAESKTYFDGKKMNAKTMKVKPFYSYGIKDIDKKYPESMWIKVFHSDDKGFDGKIKTVDSNDATSPISLKDIDSILNKKLHVKSLEIYSRHIWFDKTKGTSINLTLNDCCISFDVPEEYEMDAIDDGHDDNDDDVNVDIVVKQTTHLKVADTNNTIKTPIKTPIKEVESTEEDNDVSDEVDNSDLSESEEEEVKIVAPVVIVKPVAKTPAKKKLVAA